MVDEETLCYNNENEDCFRHVLICGKMVKDALKAATPLPPSLPNTGGNPLVRDNGCFELPEFQEESYSSDCCCYFS